MSVDLETQLRSYQRNFDSEVSVPDNGWIAFGEGADIWL